MERITYVFEKRYLATGWIKMVPIYGLLPPKFFIAHPDWNLRIKNYGI